jgi:flagellar biosynthetic protein FliO
MAVIAMVLIVVIPAPLLQGAESNPGKDQSAKIVSPAPESVGVTANQDIAADSKKPIEPLFTDSEWQRQQATTESPETGGAVIGKAAMGLLLSLVIIAALAWALAWASKRFGMRRVMPGRGQHVQVIETVPLGFKRAISLVRIHDQVLVVGQGEHELCHLATLPASCLTNVSPATSVSADHKKDEPNESETTAQTPPQIPPQIPPPSSSAFRQLLDSIGGRRS